MEPPSSAALLCLVFYGECLEGRDPLSVRLAVGAALKLDPTRTARLFSGRRVVMRRGVTEAKARAHVDRFAALGARLRIEPVSMPRVRVAPVGSEAASAVPLPPPLSATHATPWGVQQWGVVGALGAAAVLALVLMKGGAPDDPHTTPATAAAVVGATSPAAPPPPASAPPSAAVPAVAAGAGDAVPEDMGPDARRELTARYLQAPQHRAFAFSPSGAFGWAGGAAGDNDARDKALSQCLSRQPANADQACRIVHVDGQWVE